MEGVYRPSPKGCSGSLGTGVTKDEETASSVRKTALRLAHWGIWVLTFVPKAS